MCNIEALGSRAKLLQVEAQREKHSADCVPSLVWHINFFYMSDKGHPVWVLVAYNIQLF